MNHLLHLLARLTMGLVLLLVALFGVTVLLLGTSKGLGWLLYEVDTFLPDQVLRVERVEGGLFGQLHLYGVHYGDPAMSVEVDELVLRWRPLALRHQRLHLVELGVEGLRYRQLVPSPEEPSGPLVLEDLALPVEVLLDRVWIKDARMVASPGAEPLVLQQALLRARWDHTGITLEQLAATIPEIKLDLDGHLDPRGDWPLDLRTKLVLRQADLPEIDIGGRVEGDLRRMDILLRSSGPLGVRFQGTLEDVLEALRWRGTLDIHEVPAEIMGQALPPGLQGRIETHGDLKRAAAELSLDWLYAQAPKEAAPPPGNAELHSASSTPGNAELHSASSVSGQSKAAPSSASRDGSLKLGASVDLDTLEFDAKGSWRGVQWPLGGVATVTSRGGSLQAQGNADDYQFDLQVELAGADIPPGNWFLRGRGDRRRAVFEEIRGETLGGQLNAEASVAWKPALQWRAKLEGTGLDPGRFDPEWPGAIDLKLEAEGSDREGKTKLSVALDKLGGNLRGYPLHGSGGFGLDGPRISVNQLELRSGKARIAANGALGPDWDLDWEVHAPKLAELLPEAKGRIQAQGKLSGTRQAPAITATLVLRGLAYQDLGCKRLDGDIALDSGARGKARVSLAGKGIVVAGQQVQKLSLDIDGPLDQQQIRLALVHPQGSLRLDARGAFDQARTRWQGEIRRLDIHLPEFGDWGLGKAVALRAAADAVSLGPLCLRQDRTALCTEADWTPTSGQAKLSLREFSLTRLQPLLPPELTELEGMLRADLDASLGPLPTAKLNIVLAPGQIAYRVDQGRQIRLHHRGSQVDAELDKERLSAQWKLEVGDNGASGELTIPRPALEREPAQAPLRGRVEFDVKQLGLLTAFVPDIRETKGGIEGKLRLTGVLGAPLVAGTVELDMPKAVIPRVGLEVKDIRLRIKGDGSDRLRIDGGLGSGPGRLAIEGSATLDAGRGWPAKLTIQGQRFQAVNLPDTQVLISPEIQIEHNSKGITVTGTITVPKARAVLNTLPSSARSISSDVVIVSADSDAEEGNGGLPIHARVTIVLGKKVHFRGFGLNADLGGRLTITQQPGRIPVGNGELGIVQGTFRALGQDLNIEQGTVFYAGGPLNNPGLNLKASRFVNDLTVGLLVTGTAKDPEFTGYSSDPRMTEDDAMSLLLTGHAKGQGDSSNTKAYIGANLTDKISVGTETSLDGDQQEFVGRYRFNRRWSIKTTSSAEKSGAEVVYTIELE